MKRDKTRLIALDALRGWSALFVVFYHFAIDPRYDPMGYTHNFFTSQAYVFVDLFFVLSGYVIAYNYFDRIKNKKDLYRYIKLRFFRLYPLLFYSVVLYIPIKLYAMHIGFDFDKVDYGYKDLFIDAINPLLLINSFPIMASDAGLNPVSWSVSAEMFSYVIFAGMLLVFQRNKKVIILVISMLLTTWLIYHGRLNETSDLGFLRGLLGFSLGVNGFLWRKHFRWSNKMGNLYIIAIFSIMFLSAHYDNRLLLLLPYLYTFLIVSFSFAEKKDYLFTNKFSVYLGKISYSVYLNHYLVLWLLYYVGNYVIDYQVSILTTLISLVLVVITTLVYSNFTYKYIEKFFMQWVRRR